MIKLKDQKCEGCGFVWIILLVSAGIASPLSKDKLLGDLLNLPMALCM